MSKLERDLDSDVKMAKDKPIVTSVEAELRKDGGCGWVICFAAGLVQFVVLGIHNSFGILYIVFVREYNWSKALTGKYLSTGLVTYAPQVSTPHLP